MPLADAVDRRCFVDNTYETDQEYIAALQPGYAISKCLAAAAKVRIYVVVRRGDCGDTSPLICVVESYHAFVNVHFAV
jgi:hypothetical protein